MGGRLLGRPLINQMVEGRRKIPTGRDALLPGTLLRTARTTRAQPSHVISTLNLCYRQGEAARGGGIH